MKSVVSISIFISNILIGKHVQIWKNNNIMLALFTFLYIFWPLINLFLTENSNC